MIQDDLLGDYTLADDELFDVQTITDAMMTTAQSLTELALRFFLNLLVAGATTISPSWRSRPPWCCSST